MWISRKKYEEMEKKLCEYKESIKYKDYTIVLLSKSLYIFGVCGGCDRTLIFKRDIERELMFDFSPGAVNSIFNVSKYVQREKDVEFLDGDIEDAKKYIDSKIEKERIAKEKLEEEKKFKEMHDKIYPPVKKRGRKKKGGEK